MEAQKVATGPGLPTERSSAFRDEVLGGGLDASNDYASAGHVTSMPKIGIAK